MKTCLPSIDIRARTNLPLQIFQMNYGISLVLYSNRKTKQNIGRPIIPFRKVMDGILYVLRTRMSMEDAATEYGSGSTCHRRFQQWVQIDIFKKIWIRLLTIYDSKRGIKWIWQSLDSISIKSSLGGQ